MSSLAGQRITVIKGNDEFAIEKRVKKIYNSISDPTMAQMIFSRMDMTSVEINRVREEAYTIPFMATERFVVLDNAISPFIGNVGKETLRLWQEEFLGFLAHLPSQTTLFLIQNERNKPPKEIDDGKASWIADWANSNGADFKVESFMLPIGRSERIKWLADEAGHHAVTFDSAAMELINQNSGEFFDTRILAQEIAKLAAYVNYSRPITSADILDVGISNVHFGIFPLVDAIGSKQTNTAMKYYRGLLEEIEPEAIFPLIQRQFRLILQAKYAQEHHIPINKISGLASTFVSGKIVPQARNFSYNQLKNYYKALLEIDETVKSTAITLEVALEIFIIRSCGGYSFPKNFLCSPPRWAREI